MIECVLSVEQEEYRALYEVIAKQRKTRWLRLVLPLTAVVATVLALVVPMPLFVGMVLLLYSVSALFWYVFYPQFQAWDAYRHRDQTAEIAAFTYWFDEDTLHILHPTHAQVVPYTVITACTETETHFVLFAGQQVFCMAKETMTKGTVDELRALLSDRFVYNTVKVERAQRHRAVFALTTAIVTVALIIAVRGATYIRRPVTVTVEGHTLTLSLPQFMQYKGEGQYIGNGIESYTEYITKATMKERIDTVLEKAPEANLANYATYLQESQAVPTKGEWVPVSDREYYMSYADGSFYRYTILRADGDGVWVIWFRSPGERQDTYYNRFDTWREDIYSK